MKCQNCNSEITAGAKFCTTCGTTTTQTAAPAAPAPTGATCSDCNSPLAAGVKFCTTCGKPVVAVPAVASTPAADPQQEMSMVKQRIFWNIQKGEIAHSINEAEFIRYDSAQGLIVNDGTTAYVKANGKVIAEIHGGVYDFISAEELNKTIEARTGGLVGGAASVGRMVLNAVLGQRAKDRFDDKDDPRRQQSLDAVIECLKRKDVFALHLKLDKSFSLVFGAGTSDDIADFAPMKIRTGVIDMEVGVRAIFRIADFNAFSQQFMVDSSVVTTQSIAIELRPAIQKAVQDVFGSCTMENTTVSAEQLDAITAKIVAMSSQFHGLVLEQVAEVATNNEDFERLRSLSRELYLSEQELDYLRRTNDFRNRLTTATNAQTIEDARNEYQLNQGLQEINKDNLLLEDELDKFYTVLSREKRIRDAKSEDEVQAALDDIARTGLLREDDMDALRAQVAQNDQQRGQALRMMQLGDEVEFERVRTSGAGEVQLEGLRQALNLQELELKHRRGTDTYTDERRTKEREQQLADRRAEQQADDAEMDAQIERLRKIKEMERTDRQSEHEQQREMVRLKQEALDKQSQMTAEQLMAIAAAENLDSAAANTFAQSFSAGRNVEQVQQAADARIADAHRHEGHMMDMMQQMREMATTMTGHIVQQKEEQRQEARGRADRQEARVDSAQHDALEYATRNNSIDKSVKPAPAPSAACPKCGAQMGGRFCPACGFDIK